MNNTNFLLSNIVLSDEGISVFRTPENVLEISNSYLNIEKKIIYYRTKGNINNSIMEYNFSFKTLNICKLEEIYIMLPWIYPLINIGNSAPTIINLAQCLQPPYIVAQMIKKIEIKINGQMLLKDSTLHPLIDSSLIQYDEIKKKYLEKIGFPFQLVTTNNGITGIDVVPSLSFHPNLPISNNIVQSNVTKRTLLPLYLFNNIFDNPDYIPTGTQFDIKLYVGRTDSFPIVNTYLDSNTNEEFILDSGTLYNTLNNKDLTNHLGATCAYLDINGEPEIHYTSYVLKNLEDTKRIVALFQQKDLIVPYFQYVNTLSNQTNIISNSQIYEFILDRFNYMPPVMALHVTGSNTDFSYYPINMNNEFSIKFFKYGGPSRPLQFITYNNNSAQFSNMLYTMPIRVDYLKVFHNSQCILNLGKPEHNFETIMSEIEQINKNLIYTDDRSLIYKYDIYSQNICVGTPPIFKLYTEDFTKSRQPVNYAPGETKIQVRFTWPDGSDIISDDNKPMKLFILSLQKNYFSINAATQEVNFSIYPNNNLNKPITLRFTPKIIE